MNFENRVQVADQYGVPVAVENNALRVDTSDHFVTVTEEYTASGGAVTAVSIATPTPGKDIGVKSVSIRTESASGTISLDFATSGIKVARAYPAKNAPLDSADMHIVGAVNEPLTFSATGLGQTDRVFVIVNYVEH